MPLKVESNGRLGLCWVTDATTPSHHHHRRRQKHIPLFPRRVEMQMILHRSILRIKDQTSFNANFSTQVQSIFAPAFSICQTFHYLKPMSILGPVASHPVLMLSYRAFKQGGCHGQQSRTPIGLHLSRAGISVTRFAHRGAAEPGLGSLHSIRRWIVAISIPPS
jgi:hypothetical protein